MKCDELEEEYLWTNNVKTPSTIMVRAYNADEVDKAIAELKARIQLDDDEMAGFLDLEEECGGGDLRNYIAELKAKLENVQASRYADSVDAGMRERRLRRALWLDRFWRAQAMFWYWCARFATESGFTSVDIFGYVNTTRKSRQIRDWMALWQKVERKCRAKAEEYK